MCVAGAERVGGVDVVGNLRRERETVSHHCCRSCPLPSHVPLVSLARPTQGGAGQRDKHALVPTLDRNLLRIWKAVLGAMLLV